VQIFNISIEVKINIFQKYRRVIMIILTIPPI